MRIGSCTSVEANVLRNGRLSDAIGQVWQRAAAQSTGANGTRIKLEVL